MSPPIKEDIQCPPRYEQSIPKSKGIIKSDSGKMVKPKVGQEGHEVKKEILEGRSLEPKPTNE